jgi:DNA-binding XRE family transcriptional regulator
MLNFFRGGPIDGYAYDTSTLLQYQDLVLEYRWVPKVIISKKNDDTARVWLHDSLPDDAVIVVDQDRHDLLTIEQEDRRVPTIEKRRKELKLSREGLGDLVGMTHAQIQRIEQGGPRTTDAERRQIEDVLDRLEVARSAHP